MVKAPLPQYLEILNPEQREAVLHTGNSETHSLLILAGAGSGKTRVITTKIAYLIREKGLDPRSILAVTFTNKAAREMADRARAIEPRAGDAMLRTFHSFGAWFLRRNGSLAALPPGFVIYDDDDMVSLLSTIMEGAPRAEVKIMAHGIARSKDYFLSPDDPELDLIDHRKLFRTTYARYEERLAKIGNVDFGDLIKKPVEILRQNPEVASRFRDRFKVIMVDEYQDANIAQFELLKELSGTGTYICVVGDDDQSIYRFRGAEVRNILEFPDRFPGTDIIRLERNYRSTAPILHAAASVVNHNEGRLGKELRSERGPGKKPVLAFLPDQDEEASFCAELISKAVKGSDSNTVKESETKRKTAKTESIENCRYSDWAILYRTNAQSLGFETEFLRRRIPYRVVGSLKFYEREEIKDALALLSFLVNPRDEVAFRRVVNKPSRGVGPSAIDKITEEAGISIIDELDGLSSPGDLAAASRRISPDLSAKARSGVAVFLKAIDAGRKALKETDSNFSPDADDDETGTVAAPSADIPGTTKKRPTLKGEGLQAGEGLSVCVVRLAEESGIAEHHLTHDEIAGNQRLNNLQELANAASLYPATMRGLLEFLEHIELDRSMEENSAGAGEDMVTLITLHNTKGLEFKRVIMTGVEQGVFPRDDKNGDDLEEERRLFYVGATRAMDELYFCSCGMRRMFGRTMPMEPSSFLREIDREGLRIIGKAPYGFARPSGTDSAGSPGKAGKITRSSDGRWQIGDKVFHDDQGYGTVAEIKEGEDGPIVKVHFETGHETRFLSLHQSSHFTKISED
ncbi:ATP-dependent helicase [Leadbettera azotonutricia]|uniref:DNA 3'-5' helicase n=1 Tax=Leadbettera azotonutricia (strain ATCC BAA-888 / DSM 13862 / ZAS-9) TaxID=545695 RepID=F5YD77_LEAAZ|nr:UvrD-helicase domain-containing protein [Leadbettera azotonutricia]AEF81064.1 DNA helicase II [Leadbettera azotonutricia ZAS-9]